MIPHGFFHSVALKNGWRSRKKRADDYVGGFIYEKDKDLIIVYPEKSIVDTHLYHPRKNFTILRRFDLKYKQIKRLFKNPRSHLTNRSHYLCRLCFSGIASSHKTMVCHNCIDEGKKQAYAFS